MKKRSGSAGKGPEAKHPAKGKSPKASAAERPAGEKKERKLSPVQEILANNQPKKPRKGRARSKPAAEKKAKAPAKKRSPAKKAAGAE